MSRRTAADFPPEMYIHVKDRLPPDPAHRNRRRCRHHRKIITLPYTSTAVCNNTLPAVLSPKIVEQTSTPPLYIMTTSYNVEDTSAPSPPNIVEQDTPLPTTITTKLHHLPTLLRPLDPAHHHFLSPPPIVDQMSPMSPPNSVEDIMTTKPATSIEITNTASLPLNYIHIISGHNTHSTTTTVSSSSITTSHSCRRHFPLRRTQITVYPLSQKYDFHQISNIYLIYIVDHIRAQPSLLQESSAIDTELSSFLLKVWEVGFLNCIAFQ